MARQSRQMSNVIAPRKSVVTEPRKVEKIRRNDPCPCGSGKKYKSCHAQEGEAFLERLERDRHQEELKKQGVPWIVRWLRK